MAVTGENIGESLTGRISSLSPVCDLILFRDIEHNNSNNNVEVEIHLDLLLPSSNRTNKWTKLIPNDDPLIPQKFQDKFLRWIIDSPKNTSVGEVRETSNSCTHHHHRHHGGDESGDKENDSTQRCILKAKLCSELQTLFTRNSGIGSGSTHGGSSQPTPRKRTRSSFSSDLSSPPASSTRKKMKMTPHGSENGSDSGLRQRRRTLVQRGAAAGSSSKYLLSHFRDLDTTVKARYFLSFSYLFLKDPAMMNTKSNDTNDDNSSSHENKIVMDFMVYLDVLTSTTMGVLKLESFGLEIVTTTTQLTDMSSSSMVVASSSSSPSVLGEGSFGIVYLLSSVDRKVFYALKVFQQQNVVDADDVKHEAETQELFDHPGIVKGIDHFIDSSYFTWMLSVAVDGRSLSEKEQCKPFEAIDLHSWSRSSSNDENKNDENDTSADSIGIRSIDWNARRFFAGAVLALLHIHSCGKCHRDVKPDNCVLYGGDPGCPVLIDLGEGSAIIVDSDDGAKNTTVAGAYEYRDHQMNEDGYDPVKADLYSLALTTIAVSIGVDRYENLTTEEGWTKYTTKGPAIQKAFDIASKILHDDAVNLLRRMTSDDLCERPSYGEIFSNPWVVQGWQDIKDLQHYDTAKSISLKQQSFMIDSFKA